MRLKFLDSFEKQIFDGKVLENPITGFQTIVSILIGLAATFIATIISLFIDGVETENTVMQITVYAGGAIALVWYLLHTQKVLFSNLKIGIKVGYGFFLECSNCQHNTSRSSLNGFCELRGGNVSASDCCGSWDPC